MKTLWLHTVSAMKLFFRKREARKYIREFWNSKNGKEVLKDLSEHEKIHRNEVTLSLLINDWLVGSEGQTEYPVSVCRLDDLGNHEITVQLFNELFHIGYSGYQWDTKTQKDIRVMALVALSLSVQLSEVRYHSIKVVITDQEVALDGSYGVAYFQVRKLTNFGGAYTMDDDPVPQQLEPLTS